MKVAYFSNTDFSLYNFRLGLMRKMKERGYSVYACASEGKYSEKLKREFWFTNLPLKRSVDLLGRDIIYLYRVYRFCKKEKPFLCHNFTIKPCIYATLAQKLAGVEKIYCTITGIGAAFEKGLTKVIAVFLYRRSLKYVDKVIFQNSDDRDLFLKLGLVNKEKTEVIKGSGVDTDYFQPTEKEGEVVVTMVSRILKSKGVCEFMEVAQRFNTEFLLVGPIDKENPSGIKREEIKNVNYLGERSDIKEILSKSDIFVLPSYREGVSRALLEAGAMGLPIITTDVPGCRDVVDDGVNGFLVEPQNAKDLEEKIRMLIKDKEMRRRMGKASREKIEREFSEKMVVEKTIKCYHLG